MGQYSNFFSCNGGRNNFFYFLDCPKFLRNNVMNLIRKKIEKFYVNSKFL